MTATLLRCACVSLLMGALASPALGNEHGRRAHSAWEVVKQGIPVTELLENETGQEHVAVVVVPLPGDLAPATHDLELALVGALKGQKHVGSVKPVSDAAWSAEADDVIARAAATRLNATLVLVVRGYPAANEGETPRLLLSLLDQDGTVVSSRTTTSVLVPRQRRVAAGVSRVFEDEAEDGDDDDSPSGEDAALQAFKHQALLLRKQHGPHGDEYVITRDGEDLTESELEKVGAPPGEQAVTSLAEVARWRKWTRMGSGTWCGAGICLSPGAVLLCLGAFPVLTGVVTTGLLVADHVPLGNAINASLYYGCCYYGCCYSWVPLLVGLGAAAATAVGSGVGGGGIFAAEMITRTPEVHPFEAFVTRHNQALADKLGIKRRKLGKRFFPAPPAD